MAITCCFIKEQYFIQGGGDGMPKFVARKPEKEVISMRIDSDLLKNIDGKAAAVGISRNELLNQMILYALSNMDDSDETGC